MNGKMIVEIEQRDMPFKCMSAETIEAYLNQYYDLRKHFFVRQLPDAKEEETCEWKQDEDVIYFTECNNGYYFADGLQLCETKVQFCPYCGKKIKEVKQ